MTETPHTATRAYTGRDVVIFVAALIGGVVAGTAVVIPLIILLFVTGFLVAAIFNLVSAAVAAYRYRREVTPTRRAAAAGLTIAGPIAAVLTLVVPFL